jgi:hypothetical protein
VVVHVRDGLVGLPLVLFRPILVSVHEAGVIVLVHVVVRAVCELTRRAAGVLMRDVPVIVRMDLRRMSVLVSFVADDLLLCLGGHDQPP